MRPPGNFPQKIWRQQLDIIGVWSVEYGRENHDDVTLITRPRRFGKTLTMSMLEHFFSVEYADKSFLFEGLDIWEEEKYHSLQGSYPVIFLSFADVKETSFENARDKICRKPMCTDIGMKWQHLSGICSILPLRQICIWRGRS